MFEYLPSDIGVLVRSLFERHYSNALQADSRDCCLYPRMLLCEAKNDTQIFKYRDTHMTDYGSAIVTREIFRWLGHDHDSLAYMDKDIRHQPCDLARMAGMRSQLPHTALIPREKTHQIWSNRLSLPSNTDNIVISFNPHAIRDQRLLILGDSFMIRCLASLSTFYKDILYVRSAQFQPELLDLFAPDAVITANAERYLSEVALDEPSESVFMRGYGRKHYQPTQDFVNALRAQFAWKHYPHQYQAWSTRMKATSFDGVGIGQLNDQICYAPNEPGWLVSIGKDPQIIFHGTTVKEGRDYRLRIGMYSDVEGMAQLFVRHINGSIGFSAENSFRRPVHPGLNSLEFDLPSTETRTQLRFDPLNLPGRFRILDMCLHA